MKIRKETKDNPKVYCFTSLGGCGGDRVHKVFVGVHPGPDPRRRHYVCSKCGFCRSCGHG